MMSSNFKCTFLKTFMEAHLHMPEIKLGRGNTAGMMWFFRVDANLESFPNFSDARPSGDEQEVFDRVAHVLSFAPGIITELKSYKGAVEEIRIVSFDLDIISMFTCLYLTSV